MVQFCYKGNKMENLQGIIDTVVKDFENKPFNSPTQFFNELLELSREWDHFIFPKKRTDEEVEHDEIKDWIYHSAKKVLLLERVRRILTFRGMSSSLIKEELVRLNRFLLNNDSRLKINIKKDKKC